MPDQKEIVVLYHSSCPDGFGAAFAAWKKFGDAAEYIPVSYGNPLPPNLAGKEVYIVDFSYDQPEAVEALKHTTKSVVVLDHHESNQMSVESFPNHVYDNTRSGATIAWNYFHPDTPTPRLFTYLEDGDLYRYALPETRNIFTYLLALDFNFGQWDKLARDLEQDASRAEVLRKAEAYEELFDALVKMSVERAKKVRFEGYEVYFSATHPNITMRSKVAHDLYMKHPPFAIMATAHPDGFGVSLRGDLSLDLSKIAAKYGGGGHPGSAGFFVPLGTPVPWEKVKDDENSSD